MNVVTCVDVMNRVAWASVCSAYYMAVILTAVVLLIAAAVFLRYKFRNTYLRNNI